MTNLPSKHFVKAYEAVFIGYAVCLPLSITGAQTCLVILLLLAAYRAAIERRWRPRPLDIALLAFLAWTLAASLFSVDPGNSVAKAGRFWVHLAWFALASAYATRGLIVRASKAYLASAAFVGLYGTAQYFWGPAVPRFLTPKVDLWQPTGAYYHAVGFFDHHLTYGNALLLCLIVGVGLALSERGRRRLVPALLCAAVLMGLILSFARSAWAAAAFVLLLFGYLKGRRFFWRATGAGAALLVLLAVASPALRDRLGTMLKPDKNIERIYIWKTSLDMALDHPIMGIGPGLYRSVTDHYRQGYNFRWTTSSHAHNSYLMTAAESGFVGLALFLAVLSAAFFKPVRVLGLISTAHPDFSLLAAFVSGMAGFAVASLFQHNFGDAEVVMAFWFLVAGANILAGDIETNVSMPVEEG